jgi:hypothetical protein
MECSYIPIHARVAQIYRYSTKLHKHIYQNKNFQQSLETPYINVCSSTVTVSIQTFVPSVYKSKNSFSIVFLCKRCEVFHKYFLQCALVPKSFF